MAPSGTPAMPNTSKSIETLPGFAKGTLRMQALHLASRTFVLGGSNGIAQFTRYYSFPIPIVLAWQCTWHPAHPSLFSASSGVRWGNPWHGCSLAQQPRRIS